jgi:hypothetical protein
MENKTVLLPKAQSLEFYSKGFLDRSNEVWLASGRKPAVSGYLGETVGGLLSQS